MADMSRLQKAPGKPWTLETSLEVDQLQAFANDLKVNVDATPYFSQATKVSGVVAEDAKSKAVIAIIVSMIAIVLYVWFRFQNAVFGIAAVIALLHDVLITIGALAVSSYVAPYLGWAMIDPFKISLEVVAALLTIVGFSINDTIVIFDRIREIKGKSPDVTERMVNQSVNQTLGRTILTTGTGVARYHRALHFWWRVDPSVLVCNARRFDLWYIQYGLHCRTDRALVQANLKRNCSGNGLRWCKGSHNGLIRPLQVKLPFSKIAPGSAGGFLLVGI